MSSVAGIAYSEHRGGSSHDPPLVLIHGAGGDCLHWPPQLRRLDGKCVYGLDLPGHGESPGEGERTVHAYANRLVAWMDAMGIDQVVPCGHSMGGAISMTAALEYPDRVAALVLVGTGARLRVSPDILEITANEGQLQAAVDLIVSWAFSPSASPRLIELGRERYGSAQLDTMHYDFVACNHFDVMDRLEEIECVALIICGEDDQLTPAKYSRFLADHIPQASLEIIPGAGHMVMLEKPEEIARSIGIFMEKIKD